MCNSCKFRNFKPEGHPQGCTCWDCLNNFDSRRFHRIQKDIIEAGFTYLHQGAGRAVYLSRSGQFVYKVPLNAWGLEANLREHQIYRHPERDRPIEHSRVARCRLAPSGVLVMELVRIGTRKERAEHLPMWATEIDSEQVGWNRAGHPVAYDYGGE